MYDIVLIYPPAPYMIEPYAQEHLGLLYLVSGMRKKGWKVAYRNLAGTPVKEALNNLPEAELYGFTTTFVDYDTVEGLSKELLAKGKKTILGGPYVTVCFDRINQEAFSAVLLGEGDITLDQVLKDSKKGELRKLYKGEVVADLDTLPFPAREDGKEQKGSIFIKERKYGKGGATNIISSRGCPFNCAFCGSRSMWGGKLRYRSISNVLAEMEECIVKYGVRNFRISDDNVTHNIKRVKELCDGVLELQVSHNIKLYWRISSRVCPSSVELWTILRNAGCVEVSFGIESFDQNVLNTINKGTTVEQNIKAIRETAVAGVNTRLLMMINTPGETAETIDKNIECLTMLYKEGVIAGVSCKPFIPMPGCDIWDNPEKYGIIMQKEDIEAAKYNYWQFTKNEEGEVVENPAKPIHRLVGTTSKVMKQRRDKMFKFLKEYNMNAEAGISRKSGKKNNG